MPLPRAAGSCLYNIFTLQLSQCFQGPRCNALSFQLVNVSQQIHRSSWWTGPSFQRDSKCERSGGIMARDVRGIHTFQRRGCLDWNMNTEEKYEIFVRFMGSEGSYCCHVFKSVLILRGSLYLWAFILLSPKTIFSLTILKNILFFSLKCSINNFLILE
jgi:hypothetical protein